MPYADPDVQKAYDRAYREKHREKQRAYTRQYQADNRDRLAIYRKRWYEKAKRERPEELRRIRLRVWLDLRYGITIEEYESLVALQGNKCAICGRVGGEGRGKVLHIDHNHKTGVVRGLLCKSCNQGIGLIGEVPELLEAAARYLRERGW